MFIQPPVSTTTEIDLLLARDSVVAVGLSAGKDSISCLIAVDRHLNEIGHRGPRVAVHSCLGRIEWPLVIEKCQEACDKLGWELLVVRRNAGDMMDRWLVRWENNVKRYIELSCVQLILPWSTPGMRFCTSELKTIVIRNNLKRIYPKHNIVNATGIRREESANRAKMPVAKYEPQSVRKGYDGYQWNPIIEWKIGDVWAAMEDCGIEPHHAYTEFKMSRLSCTFCIMSNAQDMVNSSSCPSNHDIYREMVDLEVTSTFSFQSNKWLADVNPSLLSSDILDQLQIAKKVSIERKVLEAGIPKHLLYASGWPTCIPNMSEAAQLAEIRSAVAEGVGLSIGFTDADSIIRRYEELMAIKIAKGGHPLEDTSPTLIPALQILEQQQLSFF